MITVFFSSPSQTRIKLSWEFYWMVHFTWSTRKLQTVIFMVHNTHVVCTEVVKRKKKCGIRRRKVAKWNEISRFDRKINLSHNFCHPNCTVIPRTCEMGRERKKASKLSISFMVFDQRDSRNPQWFILHINFRRWKHEQRYKTMKSTEFVEFWKFRT